LALLVELEAGLLKMLHHTLGELLPGIVGRVLCQEPAQKTTSAAMKRKSEIERLTEQVTKAERHLNAAKLSDLREAAKRLKAALRAELKAAGAMKASGDP
jgi:hypothetical protein